MAKVFKIHIWNRLFILGTPLDYCTYCSTVYLLVQSSLYLLYNRSFTCCTTVPSLRASRRQESAEAYSILGPGHFCRQIDRQIKIDRYIQIQKYIDRYRQIQKDIDRYRQIQIDIVRYRDRQIDSIINNKKHAEEHYKE